MFKHKSNDRSWGVSLHIRSLPIFFPSQSIIDLSCTQLHDTDAIFITVTLSIDEVDESQVDSAEWIRKADFRGAKVWLSFRKVYWLRFYYRITHTKNKSRWCAHMYMYTYVCVCVSSSGRITEVGDGYYVCAHCGQRFRSHFFMHAQIEITFASFDRVINMTRIMIDAAVALRKALLVFRDRDSEANGIWIEEEAAFLSKATQTEGEVTLAS